MNYSLAKRGAVVVFGVVALGWLLASAWPDEPPPKPRTEFEIAREQEPVKMARTRALCRRVFTREELVKLEERCRSHGGVPRSDEDRVTCFRHDPGFGYFGSVLWVLDPTDYPWSENHDPLPSWVESGGYRLVKTQ
jgi:hypothetical protein